MPHTALVIIGPTASGKTFLSLQLARQFNTSIISADSRQCYRELNIGVAKPTTDELSAFKHYFINTHSIFDKVDAAVFERESLVATKEIFQQSDILILSGGTGLYVKTFCQGIDAIPSVDTSVREQVRNWWEEGGINLIREKLAIADPAFLSRTYEPDNPVRLMRALEVRLSSGHSILEFQSAGVKKRDFRIRKIRIDWPRELLYQRIDHRVDLMLEAGLLQEAQQLYPYRHLPALQTVGYQELFAFMDGAMTLEEAIAKIKQHTRNYAKRQMTWFRKEGADLVIDGALLATNRELPLAQIRSILA